MNAPAWTAGWDHASGAWAAALGRACWQGGLVFLVVWMLCRGFSAMSPTLRAWLWRLAYLKLALTFLLPTISVPILPAASRASTSVAASPTQTLSMQPDPAVFSSPRLDAEPSSVSAPRHVSASPLPYRPQWSFWLSLLWAGGVVWCLTCVAGEWIAAGWLRGLSEPVQDDALNACCLELSQRLGLREPPRLLVSEGAGSPVLLGGSHPVIILPLTLLTDCSQPELELVIAHELAHRSRRDLLWGWVPAIGHALFFFFPVEWLAAHEYRLAQETACDELAIRTARARVGDYGEALLKVAARHRPNLQSRLVTVGIVESSQILKRRLVAMKEIGSFPVRPGAATTAIVALGLVACIPWQITPRALAAPTPNTADSSLRTAPSAGTDAVPSLPSGQPDSGYRSQPSVAATSGNESALRYRPKAGESYIYAVKIETTASDYTETMHGNVTYTCRTADDNGIVLTCTGGLLPVRRALQGGAFPGSPFLRLQPFGFGALGFPRPFAGPNEIKIDAQGHLLSTRGDTPLPRALGDLSQLIIETLPADGANWEVQNGCVIALQEAQLLSPISHFARVEKRNLPAVETLTYTLGTTNGDLTGIQKHYDLRTNERSFGSPTLQMTGDGTLAFDSKLGMPRTLEFKLMLTEQPDRTTTTRIPVTVTYRLLEGDEREKALHPPIPPPPVHKPLAEADLASALSDLQASDGFKVLAAAGKLADAQQEGDRRRVERALIGALDHKDGFARQNVVKALGIWGGTRQRAGADQTPGRRIVRGALGRIRRAGSAAGCSRRRTSGEMAGKRPGVRLECAAQDGFYRRSCSRKTTRCQRLGNAHRCLPAAERHWHAA